MTLLDEIIDGSTDSSVAAADLLRKVRIAAFRLGATNISDWAKYELDGYPDEPALPKYRVLSTNVVGCFAGPFRSQVNHNLPEVAGMEDWFKVDLRQPLAELQAFTVGEVDPTREWPAFQVQRYEQGGYYTIEYHTLFSAANVLTRQSLRGIVDTVRNRALDFALELQTAYPDAGSAGGPTVATTPALAQTVFNITNNITGDGTNVAAGTQITQKSVVRKADIESLRTEATRLGLADADVDELVGIVEAEPTVDSTAFTRFVGRIRDGAMVLGTSVASDVIAGAIIEAVKQYLGLS